MKEKVRSIAALLAILMLIVVSAPLANTESAMAVPSLDTWEVIPIPDATGNVLLNCDITDMAVGPDGNTIYVIDGNVTNTVYKSTNGGSTFEQCTLPPSFVAPPRAIAIAPDNPNVVAVSDSAANEAVWVTTNGGVTWAALPALNGAAANMRILDIKVGSARIAATLGRDYLVATADETAGVALGSLQIIGETASWINIAALGTADLTSCEFSPNFIGDRVVLAVGSTAAATFFYTYNVQNYSTVAPVLVHAAVQLNGVTVDFGAAANGILVSDIAVPSDYDPTTPTHERAYASFASAAAAPNNGGVYRCDDLLTPVELGMAGTPINSIAFSGTVIEGKLLAGERETTKVWYTTNPSAVLPTWSACFKPPTGATDVVLGMAPDFATTQTCYAGTSGPESGFSRSTNNAVSFNQLSLIDTTITTLDDVMPSPDGGTLFLSTTDNVTPDSSLWRTSSTPLGALGTWERVRLRDTTGWIIRLSPEYSSDATIYWCDRDGTDIQRSADTGEVSAPRYAPTPTTDVAVEDSDILYAASGSNVSKSTNGGWSFGLPVNAGIGPIFMLAMAPTYPALPVPGHILVGGIDDNASYSTDGGNSFTPLPPLPVGGNVQMTVDPGYATNNIVYAGSSNGNVYRWVIGTSTVWEEINPTIAAVSGLAVHCGCLYAADATPGGGVYRMLCGPPYHLINGLSGEETFDQVPSALRCSDASNGHDALFTIDTTNNVLYEYMDTEACNPALICSLPVTLHPQETSMWCWAASGQMVMDYLGHNVSQCVQANNRFGRDDCCTIVLCPIDYAGGPCASGGWPEFDKYGFSFKRTASAALSWDQVRTQTSNEPCCSKKPFAFTWAWPGGGGHMMVAIGYATVDGVNYVDMLDPWSPCVGDEAIITYDYYVSSPGHHTHWDDFYDVTYVGP